MSRQAGKSHSASTQKLLDKYSSAFIRHKPVRAYQGYSAVPNEIRESAMFEQTPDDVNANDEVEAHNRRALSSWETEAPRYEKDMPRRHAQYNAGMMNARYNGGLGNINRPNHAEMMLGDIDRPANMRENRHDFRPMVEADKARFKFKNARMPSNKEEHSSFDSPIQPDAMAKKIRDLNFKEMKSRLAFIDTINNDFSGKACAPATKPGAQQNFAVNESRAEIVRDATAVVGKSLAESGKKQDFYMGVPDHRKPVTITKFMMVKSKRERSDCQIHILGAVTESPQSGCYNDDGSRENKAFIGVGARHGDGQNMLTNIVNMMLVKSDMISKDGRDNELAKKLGIAQNNMSELTHLRMDGNVTDKTRETDVAKSAAHFVADSGKSNVSHLMSPDDRKAAVVANISEALSKHRKTDSVRPAEMMILQSMQRSLGGQQDSDATMVKKAVADLAVDRSAEFVNAKIEESMLGRGDNTQIASFKRLYERKDQYAAVNNVADSRQHDSSMLATKRRAHIPVVDPGLRSGVATGDIEVYGQNKSAMSGGGKKSGRRNKRFDEYDRSDTKLGEKLRDI